MTSITLPLAALLTFQGATPSPARESGAAPTLSLRLEEVLAAQSLDEVRDQVVLDAKAMEQFAVLVALTDALLFEAL